MRVNTQNTENKLKILISPDKFKGSLTALEVSEAVFFSVSRDVKKSNIKVIPIADGGDGTLDVLKYAIKDSIIKNYLVKGLDKPKISVPVLCWEDTVMIEMSKVCGVNTVKNLNVMKYNTFGLGELIKKVINNLHPNKLLISLGGSATSDGGRGMVEALGFSNTELNMDNVSKICPKLFETHIIVLSDVNNPLLGSSGAAEMFAPQKGADKNQVIIIEERMKLWSKKVMKWREVLNKKVYKDSFNGGPRVKGAGAAGGVGFALNTLLNAEILSGWDFIAERLNLEKYISEADLVISGEGKLDIQTSHGKCIGGIGVLCRKHNKPLYVVCGQNLLNKREYNKMGISQVFSIMDNLNDKSLGVDYSITHADELIKKIIFVEEK